MSKRLQEKMFLDMDRKDIFQQAQQYAFAYADSALGRAVRAFVSARRQAMDDVNGS